MIDVPARFRERIRVEYPQNNKQIFEEWFYDHYTEKEGNRIYLPVFWTSYYVNHNYGNDQRAKDDLQQFLNGLDKAKKYFTVLQYDDGILNDLTGLDIKVFGMGGGRIDYPLPLIAMPHPYKFDNKDRDIFAFFQGSMTHDIRRKLVSTLKGKDGFMFPRGTTDTKNFCSLLARSVFALAPRGYGETSFRICEALSYGVIPVYISDKFIIPHGYNFSYYGVIIHESQIQDIESILRSIEPDAIRELQENGKAVFQELYTYEANLKLILQNAC
jgi:hypothetical protein